MNDNTAPKNLGERLEDASTLLKYKVRSDLFPGNVLCAAEIAIIDGRVFFTDPILQVEYDIPYSSCAISTIAPGDKIPDPVADSGDWVASGRYLIRCVTNPHELFETETYKVQGDRIKFIALGTGRAVNIPLALTSIISK